MWPDHDPQTRRAVQRPHRLLRDAQFRRRAPPEQVAGRARDHQPVWSKGFDPPPDICYRDVVQLRVEEKNVVTVLLEQRLRIAELERQMRLAAPEIDASFECPVGIDQCELHDAALPAIAS